MTAKVISLCDYRKSRDEGKRLRSESGPGIPSQEFCDKTFERSLGPADFHKSLLSAYEPYFDLDPDDY
jgi:hypothetical protein